MHCRGFALFVRRQKLLFRSLAVRDLLVGFILHPLHVIGLILDYKLGEYGHGVDDISFIFSFVLCRMYIFVSTVTEVSISFLLDFNLGLRYIDNSFVTLRRIRITSLVFFIVGFAVGSSYVFVGKLFSLIIALLIITFSVAVLSVSYILIYRRLRQHHVQNNTRPSPSALGLWRRYSAEHSALQKKKNSFYYSLDTVGISFLLRLLRFLRYRSF